jgi:hypothetical protein
MAMLAIFSVWTHTFDRERHADEMQRLEAVGFAFTRSPSPQEPWRTSHSVLQHEEVWKTYTTLDELLGCLRAIDLPCILTCTAPCPPSDGVWSIQIRNRAERGIFA